MIRKIAIRNYSCFEEFELVKAVRSSVTIDWNLKESVRATMRTKIRRQLAKCDCPPDYEEKAIELALEQAELFAANVEED